MSTTIDSLEIKIQSDSTNAAAGIDALATALGKLKTNGSVGVAVKNLEKLSDALGKLNRVSGDASKISRLAKSMSELAAVGSINKNINQLTKLPGALSGLSNVHIDSDLGTKLNSLVSAVQPLSQVKTSGFTSMVNSLGKIADVTDKLDDTTIANFAKKVEKLNEVLTPLSTKMTTIQAGLRGVNSSARSAGDGVKHLGTKVNVTTLNMANMITVIQGVIAALRPVVTLLANTISQAMEWDGVAERFGRGFGNQAEEVYAWIQRLNEEMGINVQQFMQYSSVYATMLTGFGVAVEDAGKMALGYTELTYDIWAGYNDIYKTFGEAAEAVKSAIAGEVEPIRRAGFTIVESTLEQTAANYGLEISLEKATEAQKSYLRYLTLVDQAHAQGLVGVYAAEMNTAEGVMRTFSQQLKSLAQAFGSLFLPALVKVMPWLQAFVELLTEAIHAVAAFFGIDIQPVDFSGYDSGLSGVGSAAEDASGSLDDAAGSAGSAKKAIEDLKKATLGIDELNVISPPTDTGGSGGSGGTGGVGGGFDGLDIGSLWDESIFDKIQVDVDNIKSTIKDALDSITAVISGFMLAIGTILVVSGANIPLGLALMAAGAVGLIAVIAENWSGMSDQLAKTLTTITAVLGGFLLAIGAFLVFSGVNIGLGAALMVAGAVSLGTALTINWKFLEGDMKNTLSILTGVVSGGLLAMGALFAFTGVAVPLGIGLMVAGAVGLATAVGLNWDSLCEPMRKAIGTLEAIVGGALLTFGAILALTGANIPLGVGMIAAGAISLVSAAVLNWGSMSGDLKNQIATITALVSGALIGVGAILCFTGVAIPLGIAMIAAGAIGLVASASINWSGLTEKVKTVLKEFGAVIGGALLAVGAILAFTGVALPLGIALMAAGAVSLVSAVVLNWDSIKKSIENVINAIKDWVEKYGLLALGIILCLTGAGIPLGVALIKQGLNKKTESGDTVGNELLTTVQTKWDELKNWWNSKPALKEISAKVEDLKTKVSDAWSKVKTWWKTNVNLDTAVSLVKSGWKTVKDWIGKIPGVSQAVSLAKSGWSTVKKWIGTIPSVSQLVKLAKSGWTSVKKWVGTMPTLSAGIKLVKSGWTTVKKWLGNLNFDLGFKLPKIKVEWGEKTYAGFTIKYPTGFKTYAQGGWPDMGEVFISREMGPELVGRIGNRNAVVNNDQIVESVSEGVYAAVLAAMRASDGNGNQAVNVYLDSRQITSAVERRQHERGTSLMGKQVHAY